MDDFLKRTAGTIRAFRMLEHSQQVLAAVSGGADSVCLLLALKELGCRVSAVHVEHGIRGEESLEDCSFVHELCEREKISLTVRHIDVPALASESGRSLEETARDARYRILKETALSLGIDTVAVAHHSADQAETVLWNLMRGSSLAGLCGILPVREADIRIIRPLIDSSREEIEDWLRARGQTWRTDRTNLDLSITRNAIRLKILPEMEKLNAGAQRHIAQAAGDLAQIENYLEEVTGRAYEGIVKSETLPYGRELRLSLKALHAEPDLIGRRVVHKALGEARGALRDITREHVESVMKLSFMDNGRRISLPGGLRAVREEGVICLTQRQASPVEEEILIGEDGEYPIPGGGLAKVRFGIWEGGEVSKKKYTKTLAYDTMFPCITLRTRREGDWLVVNSQGGRRKLKDYLIDEKVPRDRRDGIWLIAQGSHVLWVIGHRISEAARVTATGAHFVQITVDTEAGTEGR